MKAADETSVSGAEPITIEAAQRMSGAGRRFTLDGSARLRAHLDRMCRRVLDEVCAIIPQTRLEALVLGGGYGRGQGGVLSTGDGDRPYNDFEFYVFLRGNRLFNERRFQPGLNALGERLSPEAGVHVEFKVDSIARLHRSGVSMFSYDLVSGHRTLWPEKDDSRDPFANCEHHLRAFDIPCHEATRLLFNRCTGLLLAKELLGKARLDPDDSDFIARNIAKAQLALGDAVLTVAGRYHWNCLERHDRCGLLASDWPAGAPGAPLAGDLRIRVPMDKPAWMKDVERHHARGVQFKLHPERSGSPAGDLAEEHRRVSELARQVWLWVESLRLNRCFSSVPEYALSDVDHWPVSSTLRNVLLGVRVFGWRNALQARVRRHPRGRFLKALAILLWMEADDASRRSLQKQLDAASNDWHSLVAAYRQLWPRCR